MKLMWWKDESGMVFDVRSKKFIEGVIPEDEERVGSQLEPLRDKGGAEVHTLRLRPARYTLFHRELISPAEYRPIYIGFSEEDNVYFEPVTGLIFEAKHYRYPDHGPILYIPDICARAFSIAAFFTAVNPEKSIYRGDCRMVSDDEIGEVLFRIRNDEEYVKALKAYFRALHKRSNMLDKRLAKQARKWKKAEAKRGGAPVRRIKRNAVMCNFCGQTIESTHVHDFQTCGCGAVSVDGGLEYIRRVHKEGASFRELSEYE